MDRYTIPPSFIDLERRKLESTLDEDLGSLSLGSLISTSSTISNPYHRPTSYMRNLNHPRDPISFSDLSIEIGRGGMKSPPMSSYGNSPYDHVNTPKPIRHGGSGLGGQGAGENSNYIGGSPVSTAGHHVSAVTLGAGVFRRNNGAGGGDESEFDPDRSLGRLVGELGKVAGGGIAPRPQSPFSAHLSPPRSPRSPSPLNMNDSRRNLTYTLNQNDPLLSPPTSRSSSGAGPAKQHQQHQQQSSSRFSSLAREIGQDIQARTTRRVLGERDDNIQSQAQNRSSGKGKMRVDQEGIRRPASAPVGRKEYDSVDVTGLSGLLATPAKGGKFGTINKNEGVGGDAGAAIPQALSSLQARLRALETENSVSRRRIRELENEVERARKEVEEAKRGNQRGLRDAMEEKSALEDLVKSLRKNLTRLTLELEQSKTHLQNLQPTATSPPRRNNLPPASDSVVRELEELRREIERLASEVGRLGGIVEAGLGARHRDVEEIERVKRDVERREKGRKVQVEEVAERLPSKLTQGLHTSAAPNPTLAPPSAGPPTRFQPSQRIPSAQAPDNASSTSSSPTDTSSARRRAKAKSFLGDDHLPSHPAHEHHREDEVDDDIFPSIRGEEMEKIFFGLDIPPRQTSPHTPGTGSPGLEGILGGRDVPPQTVLMRVIRELEDDFAHYKSIYVELADQYEVLDPASHLAKRHVLADHLREVITTLEKKADQISALNDILVVQDRPSSPTSNTRGHVKSVTDLLRTVKDSLSDEAVRRLEEGGLGLGGKGWEGRKRHGVV